MPFIEFNPNPSHKRNGDCVVRAICKAMDCGWDNAFISLCVASLREHDMPSANVVWGKLLQSNGFERHAIPNVCPNCITVKGFAEGRPEGLFVLACDNNHVVTVEDGDYYDTWDSGDSEVMYYFSKSED